MTADRKKEAREKFLLGGLLELARVASGSPEYRRLRDVGEEAFKAPVLRDGRRMLEAAE